jgi:hypothetical protein
MSNNQTIQKLKNPKQAFTLYDKAMRIVKSKGVKKISPNYYEVTSESNPLVNYVVFVNVNLNHDSFCECMDHYRTQDVSNLRYLW